MKPVVVWFRRDLRVRDHAALFHAARTGAPIVPLFIIDTDIIDRLPSDGAVFDFQAECLHDLASSIASIGGKLVLRTGSVSSVHEQIIKEVGPSALYLNRDYEPEARTRDDSVAALYRSHGIDVRSFKDHVLQEPDEVLTAQATPYVVFTPYARAWKRMPVMAPYDAPRRIVTPDLRSDAIPGAVELGKRVTIPEPGFKGGEREALRAWSRFLKDGLERYAASRDFPAAGGSSRLSPYLRFGCISVRTIVEDCRLLLGEGGGPRSTSAQKFVDELIWREFYQSVLYHYPRLAGESYRTDIEAIPWKRPGRAFEAWKQGRTGYPLVDAGMRELNVTGWMHNRVRMVVASFLTKDLMVHWREGARYFEEKLLDIETASNSGGWQWSTGAGVDPKPLRIFNPELQARRFDPAGAYIRRHVPELARVPDKFIHAPHLMPPALQKSLGLQIGKQYPAPIVDHATAAQEFKRHHVARMRSRSSSPAR